MSHPFLKQKPCTFRISPDPAKRTPEEKYARVRTYQRKYAGLPEPTRPQPATCEICDKGPSGRFKTLSLDHCHTTGKFRGWLCSRCNLGIGALGDTEASLRAAVRYLFRFNRSQKYGFDSLLDRTTASLAGKSAYAAHKLRQS